MSGYIERVKRNVIDEVMGCKTVKHVHAPTILSSSALNSFGVSDVYVSPCCNKKFCKGEVLGWLRVNDYCSECHTRLLDDAVRERATIDHYCCGPTEMTHYIYIQWFLGVNMYGTINSHLLLQGVEDFRSGKFNNIRAIDLWRFFFFGKHLISREHIDTIDLWYKRFLNLVEFLSLARHVNHSGSSVSKWWFLIVVILAILKNNMVSGYSYDIRNFMYSNFKNSYIAWIYVLGLLVYEQFFITPCALFSIDPTILMISREIIVRKILTSFLELMSALSYIFMYLRTLFKNKFFRYEFNASDNLETLIKTSKDMTNFKQLFLDLSMLFNFLANYPTIDVTQEPYPIPCPGSQGSLRNRLHKGTNSQDSKVEMKCRDLSAYDIFHLSKVTPKSQNIIVSKHEFENSSDSDIDQIIEESGGSTAVLDAISRTLRRIDEVHVSETTRPTNPTNFVENDLESVEDIEIPVEPTTPTTPQTYLTDSNNHDDESVEDIEIPVEPTNPNNLIETDVNEYEPIEILDLEQDDRINVVENESEIKDDIIYDEVDDIIKTDNTEFKCIDDIGSLKYKKTWW